MIGVYAPVLSSQLMDRTALSTTVARDNKQKNTSQRALSTAFDFICAQTLHDTFVGCSHTNPTLAEHTARWQTCFASPPHYSYT